METYVQTYQSPIGELFLTSDGQMLTGVYYNQSEWSKNNWKNERVDKDLPLFFKVRQWLDAYFKGQNPMIDFSLGPKGTVFQQMVWKKLLEIPYGQTTTYGQIAQEIAKELNKEAMSAQAVGGAVGSNPISIIIPCHRVIGKTGSITGYGGGIERKLKLFAIEKIQESSYFVPNNIKEAKSFVNYN